MNKKIASIVFALMFLVVSNAEAQSPIVLAEGQSVGSYCKVLKQNTNSLYLDIGIVVVNCVKRITNRTQLVPSGYPNFFNPIPDGGSSVIKCANANLKIKVVRADAGGVVHSCVPKK